MSYLVVYHTLSLMSGGMIRIKIKSDRHVTLRSLERNLTFETNYGLR